MGDFKKDPKWEVVSEYNRPSYFQEKVREKIDIVNNKSVEKTQHALTKSTDHSLGSKPIARDDLEKPAQKSEDDFGNPPSTRASVCLDERQSDGITELARTLTDQAIQDHPRGTLVLTR